MPDIPGTTRAQTTFLRAFRNNPSGPPQGDWPSPAVLRRWLRRPRFRAALNAVQDAIRFQTDFHIASAATAAARNLDQPENPPTPKQLENILRLSHLRQRFNAATAAAEPPKTPRDHMLSIPIHQRLTQEEFHALATRRGWSPPLQNTKDWPPPTPQDTFYFKLFQDPSALLWWIKLYNYHSTDKRYARLLELARDIVPHHSPAQLPFFPGMPRQDPDVLDGSWFKR